MFCAVWWVGRVSEVPWVSLWGRRFAQGLQRVLCRDWQNFRTEGQLRSSGFHYLEMAAVWFSPAIKHHILPGLMMFASLRVPLVSNMFLYAFVALWKYFDQVAGQTMSVQAMHWVVTSRITEDDPHLGKGSFVMHSKYCLVWLYSPE